MSGHSGNERASRKPINVNELGMGYTRPKSMPVSEFNKTIKEWRDKLAKSGFHDIELHDSGYKGKVLPYFASGKNAFSTPMTYDFAAEQYYALARSFTHAFQWQFFEDKAALYRYLWSMYSEGVPYRQMLKALAGDKVKRVHAPNCPKPHRTYKQKRGIWWMHKQIHIILTQFRQWRIETE